MSDFEGMERVGPVALIPQAPSKGPQEKVGLLDCFISRSGPSSKEPLVVWESEELRRQQMSACFSVTDWALEEEALRGIKEESWGDKTTWLTVYEGPTENDNGCWELERPIETEIKSRVRRGILARPKTKLRERRKRKNGGKQFGKIQPIFGIFNGGVGKGNPELPD
ncbi:hypothetical protein CK203_100987 [Vitis vinifera]|uniref:Uncharacterized protein n=1 Tax=Vitis vinifera TaxID=29760 RepID=A0A438DFU8_VITVI|nr:hypothetical protein CK203_100987 [Vitis vinifera]